MVTRQLRDFLDQNEISYVSIQHPAAIAADDTAASAHIAGRNFAKTVVVVIDGAPPMVVVPADRRLLTQDLRELFDSSNIRLATEAELGALFPDCEIGAMPPFGNLYGMPVYVAQILACEPKIAFNAGSHTEIIEMAFADFERLVAPQVLDFVTV